MCFISTFFFTLMFNPWWIWSPQALESSSFHQCCGLFAGWFEPWLISHPTMFFSHNKPTPTRLISPETNQRTCSLSLVLPLKPKGSNISCCCWQPITSISSTLTGNIFKGVEWASPFVRIRSARQCMCFGLFYMHVLRMIDARVERLRSFWLSSYCCTYSSLYVVTYIWMWSWEQLQEIFIIFFFIDMNSDFGKKNP